MDGDCAAVTASTAVPRRSAHWAGTLLWGVPLVFLLVFFFTPLVNILRLALEQAFSQQTVVLPSDVLRPLGFTVWQALLSTLLTLLIGLPAAFVFGRFTFPGKRILRALTTLPFILPTVVAAAGINALLGPRGWINLGLMQLMNTTIPPLQITNTLAAILIGHVFYNTTVVIRVVGSAWSQLDPRLEQAARVLGASPANVVRSVTLPLLRPSILTATLLVFLFDFTSFGVILLLGGPAFATLEVEIYTQALSMLNLPMAGLLSLVQLACTFGITWLYTSTARGLNVPLLPRLKGEGVRKPEKLREKAAVIVVVVMLVILLVLPLVSLAARSVTRLDADRGERGAVQTGLTLDYYRELFVNRSQAYFYVPPAQAAVNSLVYASVTTLISVTLGLMAAYALTRSSRFTGLLDTLIMLPLGASAVTLGLGFIVTFNHPPLDVRSFPLLIPIAHSLVAMPFVVRTVQPALASLPENYRQAAAVLGASPWQVWRSIEVPLISRSAFVGAVFSFTISLGEFGATSFLARPETPTMPVAIFRFLSQPGAMNYGQAMAMATLLMLVCGVAVYLLERVQSVSGNAE